MQAEDFHQVVQKFEHRARNSLAAIISAVRRLKKSMPDSQSEELLSLIEARSESLTEELRQFSDETFLYFESK